MFASNDEVVVAALDEAMLPSWDQLGLFAFTWFRSSRWSGLENILFSDSGPLRLDLNPHSSMKQTPFAAVRPRRALIRARLALPLQFG